MKVNSGAANSLPQGVGVQQGGPRKKTKKQVELEDLCSKMFLPPDSFNRRNPYIVIAVVREGTVAALDRVLDDKDDESAEDPEEDAKEFGKDHDDMASKRGGKKRASPKSMPDQGREDWIPISPQSVWKEWRESRRNKTSVGELGGLDPSYVGIVIKYYVIPQVTMGVYAVKGLHEKLHFSVSPELIDKFVKDATKQGIEVQFLSPFGHHNDDMIELWTQADKQWETVKSTFENLDWKNNVNVLDKKRDERNNHQDTGGTNSLSFTERRTSMEIAFPGLTTATHANNMIPDMVRMSKIGKDTGWVKSHEEREANPEKANRERARTLLFLKTMHPECFVDAMTDTAMRAGFTPLVTHFDELNGRWDDHTYALVSFVHAVIDPLGKTPMHVRFSKVAYSRKVCEDFLQRYYYAQESCRDLTHFMEFLENNDPGRLFFNEELIKSGNMKAREMVAYCFYYCMPNVDKRMFLSAFIDPIHRLAEFFHLPFEAIVDISYCVGWCTEPTKFASVLDRWMMNGRLPTHQMLCWSAVETAKEMFGSISSGRFPRCGVFANAPLDKEGLVTAHPAVCLAIRNAGTMENGAYTDKRSFEEFVKKVPEKIPNLGGFSGQHWAQVLISLLVLKRPEWSKEAYVTNTTANFERFMNRFNLSSPETVKSILQSVSLSTGHSRFVVENIYCEMYKDYTGATKRVSQARDCFHLGSRMYQMKEVPYTNKYKACYLVYGSSKDAVEIQNDWWEQYPNTNTETQAGRRNPHRYGMTMKRAYAKWDRIVTNGGKLERSGRDTLYLGGSSDQKSTPTLLDVTVEFEDQQDLRSTDHMKNTQWLLDEFEGFDRNKIPADLRSISRAGKRVCKQDSYEKTLPTEAQFYPPPKRPFEEVMGLLVAEAHDWKLPPKPYIGPPGLPVTSFKPATLLSDQQWMKCQWKM